MSENMYRLHVKRNGHFELRTPQLRPFWYKSSCQQSGYATKHQCNFMGHWLQHKNHLEKLVFAPILRLGADLAKKKRKGLFAFLLDQFLYLTCWHKSNVCTTQCQQADGGLIISP